MSTDARPGLIPGEKWKSVPPEEATDATPEWQIYHKDRTAVLTIGEKQRVVKFGACTPFNSVEELQAYADFIEQNQDFVLIYGRGQDPVVAESIATVEDGRITYTTRGIGLPEPHTQVSPLQRIHAHLFVHQNPWVPVPPEYRFWLKKRGSSSGEVDHNSENGPRYWAGGHNWSNGSKLKEFLEASGWWHGFTSKDSTPTATRTRQQFSQIPIG